MRLAIVTNNPFFLNKGGYSTDASFLKFAISFLEFFDELFFCVPVSKGTDKTGKFEVNPINTKIVELPPLGSNFKYYLRLMHQLKDTWKTIEKCIENCDLVWVVEGPQLTPYISMLLCKKQKRPYFLYIRGNIRRQVSYRKYSVIKKNIASLGILMLGVLNRLFVSNSLTFCLERELFEAYSRKKHIGIYQIVPTLIYEKDIAEGRKHTPKNVSLIYVGRLQSIKGIIYLIEAVNKLRKEGRPIRLKIVGDGPDETPLKKIVSNFGLNDCISFLGHINYGPDLLNIYQSCDIFVLPSISEGIPKVLVEAMSQGLAIIASNVGGIPSVLKEGKNGLLVRAGDSESIYQAILRLLRNRHLLSDMSENNIWDSKKFSVEVQRKKMMDIVYAHFPHLGGMQVDNQKI